jgi:type IV secretory pathway TraG/TraD family ATPase VirD4
LAPTQTTWAPLTCAQTPGGALVLVTTVKCRATVYLCFPEKDLLSKAPVIRLVLESILSEMIATYDTTNGRNCQPTLAILDEAGTVGLPSLPQYVSTVRSRGISIWLAYQDNSQIESLYGRYKARTIRNNMLSKVFYWQSDTETAKDIAISLGYRSEFSRSQTLRNGEESSQSLSEQAVPLLTARDINELAEDEIIAFHSNRKPIRAKRMDWRGFPILKKRRATPPPKLKSLPKLDYNFLDIFEQKPEETYNEYISPDRRY